MSAKHVLKQGTIRNKWKNIETLNVAMNEVNDD